jgi:prolyl-tRNA editing enzyme YbaK/EbsC (Cys-tRNA(Pro) deacylase)
MSWCDRPGPWQGVAVALHQNARRVQDALAAAGSAAQVRELPDSARTAQEAARALDVEVGQIAKSLVFVAGEQPVLVVASGADRVDEARLSVQLGVGPIKRADANIVRQATGYPIGGVSPVDLDGGLIVVVDRALEAFDVIWAAAGTPHTVFATSFPELVRISGGEVVDVAERRTT